MHVPYRMCVACRRRATKEELIRVVLVMGRAMWDESGGLPGRGAYVCRSPVCIANAFKTNSLTKALRCQGKDIGLDLLEDRLLTASARGVSDGQARL